MYTLLERQIGFSNLGKKMPESREVYEDVLNKFAAPTFSLSAFVVPNSTSYVWKVIKTGEVPEQVGMIELKPSEYLHMNALSEEQKKQYLRDRFALYFDQLRHDAGLG